MDSLLPVINDHDEILRVDAINVPTGGEPTIILADDNSDVPVFLISSMNLFFKAHDVPPIRMIYKHIPTDR
jgi:hypothetical protein